MACRPEHSAAKRQRTAGPEQMLSSLGPNSSSSRSNSSSIRTASGAALSSSTMSSSSSSSSSSLCSSCAPSSSSISPPCIRCSSSSLSAGLSPLSARRDPLHPSSASSTLPSLASASASSSAAPPGSASGCHVDKEGASSSFLEPLTAPASPVPQNNQPETPSAPPSNPASPAPPSMASPPASPPSSGSPPPLDSPSEDSWWSAWVSEQKSAGISPATWLARFGIQTSSAASTPASTPPSSPDPSSPPSSLSAPPQLSEERLWSVAVHVIRAALAGPRRRNPSFHSLDHVVDAIAKARNIIVLSGAGLSVSSGIPDFRSASSGLYSRIQAEFGLSEPQEMFDMECFLDDPKPFFTFAAEIFPGKFTPSPGHAFIRALADRGKLLRNYTQNIDTLEQVAGIPDDKIVQCHGSFATATCLACRCRVPGSDIKPDVFARTVPYCKVCPPGTPNAVLKPDIVFFGEQLPSRFRRTFADDKDRADLLLVIGSSLKVSPVSQVPLSLPDHVPQVLINREVVGRPSEFDVELLGDADAVVAELTARLQWQLPAVSPPAPAPSPYAYSSPNRYLFKHAQPPVSDHV